MKERKEKKGDGMDRLTLVTDLEIQVPLIIFNAA